VADSAAAGVVDLAAGGVDLDVDVDVDGVSDRVACFLGRRVSRSNGYGGGLAALLKLVSGSSLFSHEPSNIISQLNQWLVSFDSLGGFYRTV